VRLIAYRISIIRALEKLQCWFPLMVMMNEAAPMHVAVLRRACHSNKSHRPREENVGPF